MQTPSVINAIREGTLGALKRGGFATERVPGRKELYLCTTSPLPWLPDGSTARLCVVTKEKLVTKTKKGGFAVTDLINLERGDDAAVIIAVRDRKGRLEVYMVPKPRVIADMRACMAHWLATHPNGKSDVRTISFDGDPAHPGKGFREKYREFLVTTVSVNESTEQREEPAPTGDKSPLELALRKAALAASFEYGRPVDQIEFTIGVTFKTGEVLFH